MEANVFHDYQNLESVSIPRTMTSIAGNAFGSSVVIFGYAGSYAQSYAQNMNYPFACRMSYPDVTADAWYYGDVEYVYENGIMTGLSDGRFAPTLALMRSQFAVILHRLEGGKTAAYTAKFPDVPNGDWYTEAVMWASENGIITGYQNTGTFGPNDSITREQMAVMMFRYANYKGYDTSQTAGLDRFEDVGQVSEYALAAMRWAVGSGLISGKYDQTQLDPQGKASRAECAAIIRRFMEKVVVQVEVSSLTLDQSEITVEAYKPGTQLTATKTPDNQNAVLWRSGDNSVATVVNGLVTGVAPGYTVIIAKAGDKEAYCRVKVTKVNVTGLALDRSYIMSSVGENTALKPVISPSNASAPASHVVWTSSDPNVATVSNGVVTACGVGRATITATLEGYSATCEIGVYKRSAINYLLSYISKFGYINEDGNREVQYTATNSGFDYTSFIEYRQNLNQLVFYMQMDDVIITYFTYDISSARAYTTFYIEGADDVSYFYAGTTMDSYFYSPNTRYSFAVYEIEGDITYSDVDDLGNTFMQLSVALLDLHLADTLGIRVRDLGFLSY